MTPVMYAGCDGLVECLICSHGHVQSSCCAVVITWSLPLTNGTNVTERAERTERLRVAVLVRCGL